jgi:hypothetical protein
MSYLTDETHGRHVLVVCVKWQNGTDRQIDRSTDRQMKKGPRRPSPSASLRYRGVVRFSIGDQNVEAKAFSCCFVNPRSN